MQRSLNTRSLARAGILTGISAVLMFFEFGLPFMPPFLKVDFSNVPILILSFSLGTIGPVVGILSILVKNLISLLMSQSGGVGQLADFICSVALVIPAAIAYNSNRTKKGAILGLLIGVIAMAVMGAIANKYIMLPFYSIALNWSMEEIFALCAKVNPIIVDETTYILYGAVPFNLLKGIILAIPTMLVYKRVSRLLKK